MSNSTAVSADTLVIEKLDLLIDAITAMRQELATIQLRLDKLEEDYRDPIKSFKSSWRDAQDGKTYPVETLWDRVNG